VFDLEPRVGVFICHCGINIGAYVNVAQVLEYTRGLRYVVHAEDNLYTCSQDSQRRIVEMIKEHKLNRIVVASCTPRTHESLFRETIREAGLNPYLFEMANIRDQCSWIHMNQPEEATEKAKDLVGMSVRKVACLSPLKRVEIDVIPKALVIGGGITGMVASISLARQGFEVILVEKEKQLGGHARNIYYTLEGDDVQAFLKNSIKEVTGHRMIQVFTGASIKSVTGFIGNYETEILLSNGEVKKCEHGVVIVATGAQEYKPTEYLYGHDERVITQRELEKALVEANSKKQSKGWALDTDHLSSVVMIQCVGSRDNSCLYCSRRCCSQAIKNAVKLLELNPKVKVFVLYRDVRTYGFKEDFYTKARELGVIFIRYDADVKPVVEDNNNSLEITFFDPVLQNDIKIKAGVVVLSTGIVPNMANKEIAKMLKVPLNSDGYFLEAHVKLRPVDFATEGIFVAGLAHSPKFISEAISQAAAAAARTSTILAKGKYYAEATVSYVDDTLCVGCAVCSSLCPYEAIEMATEEDGRRHSRVNEALCKGCGTCVAACPSGAMDQYGFTRRQMMAMIDTVKGW
jgi:heterodisulfide reductase subunit A